MNTSNLLRWVGAAGMLTLFGQLAAHAATIPLPRSGPLFEDTSPLNVSYTYVAGHATDSLTVYNTNANIDLTLDGVTHQMVPGQFTLTALTDPVQKVAVSGTFNVQALYPVGAPSLQPLWNSHTLLNFGYSFTAPFRELDFEFIQQGPSVLPGVANGTLIGVIVHLGKLNTSPSWTSSFSTVGPTTKADEFNVVPLPGALGGGAVLLGVVASLRVWRRRV